MSPPACLPAYLPACLRDDQKQKTCPQKQLALRQELHWHLGRLALARLQSRLRSAAAAANGISSGLAAAAASAPGRTPLLRLAREAGTHLTEAISLAQAAAEMSAAVAAAEARTKRVANGGGGGAAVAAGGGAAAGASAGGDDGMRAREGWARAELAKLCLTEVTPEYVRYVWGFEGDGAGVGQAPLFADSACPKMDVSESRPARPELSA